MATAARQQKTTRKGPDPAARRTSAWGNPRPGPAFSPGPTNARFPNGNQPSGAFPPLANGNGARPAAAPVDPEHARMLTQISGLTGTTITLLTRTNVRFEGVVVSTAGEGDTNGITLKDVKEISNSGAPLRETLFIAVTNVQQWSSGPADAKIPNGSDTFKTDTDISNKTVPRHERELHAWSDSIDPPSALAPDPANARNVDELTFGTTALGAPWDQFAVNEKLFGVKAGFDEDAYTTKLDRNAPDFKEREKKAQQIANEILGSNTSNSHIAEERVMNLANDGSSTTNEEDKYGAVVRGVNAYVPPGARKQTGGSVTTPPAKTEIPKVAVNAPDGTAVSTSTTTVSTPSASKVPSPAPGASGAAKPADAVPAFRSFVSAEKARLMTKKKDLARSDMDKRVAALVSFSKSFRLNYPIPEDLVPILAKDEDKQRQIKERSARDAEDPRARAIGAPPTLTAVPGARPVPSTTKAGVDASRVPATAKPAGTSGTGSVMQKTVTAPSKPGDGSKKISMVIQSIPPFKGGSTTTTTSIAQPQPAVVPVNGTIKPVASPLSPTAQNKLNVNAPSFRSNAKASGFSPAGSPNPNGSTSSASANGKQVENISPQGPTNPFFGTRVPKKMPVHVKDDFNPYKHHKVIEAAQVAPTWPYNGKRYMLMFPPIQAQPQQQSPPMAPPGPPPPSMPPATTSYEEDPAAQQAAARGYVYAYPPYGYPGQMVQPMMAPPHPGAYMPGPYMQPMPYPMPPPNAMYHPSTPMGMPPHHQYMPPPPPPGAYPPPPNGAGPRPSMPPTPIPAHAHAYYHPHQSPQLQHAVPYQMMMPPPGSVPPPHSYDPNAPQPPPVSMGGVNHS